MSEDLWDKIEGIELNEDEGYEFIGPYHDWLRVSRIGDRQQRVVLFNKAHFRFWGGSQLAQNDSQAPEIAGYRYQPEREYRVLWLGDMSQFQSEKVLVRLESMCLSGIVEGAKTCDCGDQFEISKLMIADNWEREHAPGMIILALHHIGKGLGARNHALIDTMAERVALRRGQQQPDPANLDRWMEPFIKLSGRAECDELEDMVVILKRFGISMINLAAATNNPRKLKRLAQEGFVVERVPLLIHPNKFNQFELRIKKQHGHLLEFPAE